MRSVLAALLGVALLLPAGALAQTFPVVRGSTEVEFGFAGIVLPESEDGTYSAQPELRFGYFLAEGLELQLGLHGRIWPLGAVASKNYGVAGHVRWYPNLGPGNRNLYLLGGAGAARNDPPPRIPEEASVDPFARGGLGYKIPLRDLGIGFLSGAHLATEYRLEYVLRGDNDLVSGGLLALSYSL